MACKSCGGRGSRRRAQNVAGAAAAGARAVRRSPARSGRVVNADPGANGVEVIYLGANRPHYFVSPTGHGTYGLVARGQTMVVHSDDLAARPDLFERVQQPEPAEAPAVAAAVDPVVEEPAATEEKPKRTRRKKAATQD